MNRPPGHTDDEALLAAIDAAHGAAIRGFLRERWRDQQQVEDLHQEVLVRAWRSLGAGGRGNGVRGGDDFDNPRQLRRWLLTTAHNVLVDRWRAEQRRPVSPVSDEDLIRAAPTTEPIDRALDGWLIEEALDRLSSAHREVIVLCYYQGLSVAEAALRLGLAEGTIKSRSYYAVRALRAQFDELGITR